MHAGSAGGATVQLGRRPPTPECGSDETDPEAPLFPSGPSTTITRAFCVRRVQERVPMDLREREKTEVIVRRFRMDAVHVSVLPLLAKRTPTKHAVQTAASRGGRPAASGTAHRTTSRTKSGERGARGPSVLREKGKWFAEGELTYVRAGPAMPPHLGSWWATSSSRSAWRVCRASGSSGARKSCSTCFAIARSRPRAFFPAGVMLTR
jgi:hypothetical protein